MRISVLALAASALSRQLTASPIYQVVDLGSLGGGASAATAVNSFGQAAGWSLVGSQSIRAMSADGAGAPEALDPAHQSRAYGINDSGQTVGVQWDVYGNAWAVLWNGGGDGAARVLGGSDSYAIAINAEGVVAGAESGHAVRFNAAGGVESVGVNAPWSTANAINSSGGVAGTAQMANGSFRAYVATAAGPVTTLGTLGGGASYGHAINDAGWVAGGSTTVRGYLHAFLYAGGRMKDLGTFSGRGNSGAYGVNNIGQVVGYSQTADGQSSAFVWEDEVMRDLNELIAADTGWRLLEASAINNQGQIVGFGMLGGVQRAFRLDPIVVPEQRGGQHAFTLAAVDSSQAAPIPEPGSWMLVVIGLAGVAFGAKRRRRPGSI